MFKIFLDALEKRWKSSSLIVFAVGLLWLGWNGQHFTVGYLDTWFLTDAQAQTLEQRLGSRVKEVEDKVDDLAGKVNGGLVTSLERDMFTLRVEACMHPAGPLRTQFEEQISKLLAQWRNLINSPTAIPPTPSCRDLGVE